MSRALAMAGTLVVLLRAAPAIEAAPDPSQVAAAAAEANVDETDLLGALLSQGLSSPHEYLYAVGELVRPAPVIAPSLAARVACIEAKESGGANVWNKRGSGAGGVLQYMPSTFARGAREMGHPEWSLWNPEHARAVAAHDLALGRRSQWTVSGC